MNNLKSIDNFLSEKEGWPPQKKWNEKMTEADLETICRKAYRAGAKNIGFTVFWNNLGFPDDFVKENMLPKPYKKVKCLECGEEVCDNVNYKIGHLYNKHNCKPSVGDYKAKKMLKQYFN
jgi:hypothetical protein